MALLRRSAANAVFAIHVLFGLILLTGWTAADYKLAYLILLVSWPLSWIVFGYCPLTKLEFILRKPDHPELDPDAEAIQYYAHKLFGVRVPSRAVYTGGLSLFFCLLVLSTLR